MIPALTPVASSNLAGVGYDSAAGQLFVQFNNGTLYCYYRVPVAVYQGLMAAWSHGQYFNYYVRGARYPYARLA
jgi:hypothetical protein